MLDKGFFFIYSQPYIMLSYSSIYNKSFKNFPSGGRIGSFCFYFSLPRSLTLKCKLLGAISELLLLFHSAEMLENLTFAERVSPTSSLYISRSKNHMSRIAYSAVSLSARFFNNLATKLRQDLLYRSSA